jgi:GntR family transcriptional regulator
MDIVINLDSPVAVFTQLIDQIKSAVKSDALRPGDPLPSIRQLANDLNLNNKTVAKAYRLLERDAVIQTRGYRGTFVHPDAKANSTIDLHAWVRTTLEQIVGEFRAAGVTDSEIRSALTDVMTRRALRGDSHA